jgi:branched-chain amino acid transport system substrate-binding protein
MRTFTTKILALGAIAVTFGATIAAPAHAAGPSEPIKIGSVLSLTGAAAYIGEAMHQTLQMYVDQTNEQGGLLGRKLELIQYDDASDAAKSNGFAKRLIDEDQVDAIIAGNTSGATLAMLPLIERAGVPYISLAGSAAIIDPVKMWVFKTPPTDRQMADRAMQDMLGRGTKKIALLTETGAYGQSARKEGLDIASKLGLSLVADETFGPKDSDVTPQLSKIAAAGAEAVFVVGSGGGPAVITRDAAQLGLKMKLYQAGGANSDAFINQAGPASDGVYVVGPKFVIAQYLPDSDPQKAVALAYAKAFSDRWHVTPNTFGGSAYDAFMMLKQAILAAGSVDKEKVRAKIENIQNFVGVQGVFNMSPTNHLGLSAESLVVFTIKNEAFEPANPIGN